MEANLPYQALRETLTEERMSVISPSRAQSVRYDMKSVRFTEDVIPTIFDKLGDAKHKRI